MNTRELLAEVQKTPGYAEGKPDYTTILQVINGNKTSLSQAISEIPNLINPFDSIDRAVETASEMSLPAGRNIAVGLIQATYNMMLRGLDSYIEREQQRRAISAGLVTKFEESPEPTSQKIKTLEAYGIRDVLKPAEVVRKHKIESQRSTEILKEVKALKELTKLYVEAILIAKGMK